MKNSILYVWLSLFACSAYAMEQKLQSSFLDLNSPFGVIGEPKQDSSSVPPNEVKDETPDISAEPTDEVKDEIQDMPAVQPTNDETKELDAPENKGKQEEQIKNVPKKRTKNLKTKNPPKKLRLEKPEPTLVDVMKMLQKVVKGQATLNERLDTLEKFLSKNILSDHEALIQTVIDGDTKKLNQLLRKGADVNIRGKNKTTLLMLAARHGHTKIVSILLDAEADTDARNKSGDTALIEAVRNEREKIAEILLNAGAQADICNYKNETPLAIAIKKNNPKLIQMLSDALEYVSAQNKSNNTSQKAIEDDISFDSKI
jgi:hypothetical protein